MPNFGRSMLIMGLDTFQQPLTNGLRDDSLGGCAKAKLGNETENVTTVELVAPTDVM